MVIRLSLVINVGGFRACSRSCRRCEPLKRDPEQAGVARKLSVDLLTRCVVVADEHRDGRARRELELELESACRPFELHAAVRYGNDRGNRNRLLKKLLDERLRLPKRVEVDPLCAVGVPAGIECSEVFEAGRDSLACCTCPTNSVWYRGVAGREGGGVGMPGV